MLSSPNFVTLGMCSLSGRDSLGLVPKPGCLLTRQLSTAREFCRESATWSPSRAQGSCLVGLPADFTDSRGGAGAQTNCPTTVSLGQRQGWGIESF